MNIWSGWQDGPFVHMSSTWYGARAYCGKVAPQGTKALVVSDPHPGIEDVRCPACVLAYSHHALLERAA